MQVIIGGANNGKRKFVKQQLMPYPSAKIHFYDGELPKEDSFSSKDILVIGSFEILILQKVHLDEVVIAEEIFNRLIELNNQARVICICTDIGRGVVPLKKEERKLRDACGRLYQNLIRESEDVIRIWYGLQEVLKGEGL